jgi:RNA polymerase sigma-70 factor (ECF subfamily)
MRGPESQTGAPADPEAALLEALRGGDERAFETLVGRHHATMVRVARAYVASDAIAEEVAQDTWLGVIRGLDAFEGRASVKTWLFRILVNRAMTRGQREARTVPFSSLGPGYAGEELELSVSPDRFGADGSWSVPPQRFIAPPDRVEQLELRAALRAAMVELPERQRAVVALRDVEGFGSEEVCELLGLSAANLRVLLHRGRARLADAMSVHVEGAPVRNDQATGGTT